MGKTQLSMAQDIIRALDALQAAAEYVLDTVAEERTALALEYPHEQTQALEPQGIAVTRDQVTYRQLGGQL